jgi:hypothetical protein
MTVTDILDVDPPETRAPRPLRLAAWALACGLVLDVGLRGGPANAVVAAGVVAVIAMLIHDGQLEQPEARGAAMLAGVPALFLGVWTSPWLVASNVLATSGLVGLAVLHAHSGSMLDTSPARLVGRATAAAGRGLTAHRLMAPLFAGRAPSGRTLRMARAGFLALPPLAVIVVLLASGDAVFAGLIAPDLHAGRLTGHLVLIAVLAACAMGVAAAARGDVAQDDRPGGSFGDLEVITMLTLTAGVVGLFALSQLIALTGAGRRLMESAGLTPAEYARSGFFQLCWATAILVAFLAFVRALAAPDAWARSSVPILAAAVPLLALGLVAVSLRRMGLYDHAFGLTMLRLWVIGGAVWMGAVLVMIAGRNLGVGSDRAWVVGGAAAVAVALVLVADLVNPEAFVARHNIERAQHGAPLDAIYLATLSDDAVPTILRSISKVPDEAARNQLLTVARCERKTGVAALSVASARAWSARRPLCSA